MKKPQTIKKVAERFSAIPGIGPKMAERTTFFILKQGNEFIDDFIAALSELKLMVRCGECMALGEKNPCDICSHPLRDKTKLAVVESSSDIDAIERTQKYNGLYFILGGLISPLEGFKISDVPSDALRERIKNRGVGEVILATDPNAKGEATAIYLTDVLKDLDVKITRLAYGLPFGGDLEYADEITLSSAIEGRREVQKK